MLALQGCIGFGFFAKYSQIRQRNEVPEWPADLLTRPGSPCGREQAAAGLKRLRGVEVFSTKGDCQSGVLSFRVPRMDVGQVAECLGSQGIAVRSGLHCAPLAHRTAGTAETGTVRFSASVFNTPGEVEQVLALL